MLLRYAVSNFRSLDEEQEFSMVASSLRGPEGALLVVPGVKPGVSRVAAIYGANASGKTNVLRALHFVATIVEDSQAAWKPQQRIPRDPFRMVASPKDRPTTVEVDFIVEGTRYEYKIAVDAERILLESLSSFPEGRRRLLFKRDRDRFSYGKHFSGPNQLIERVTRANSLFLSAAAQNNHELLLPIYRWFAERVHFVRGDRDAPNGRTMEICADARRKPLLERFLRAADIGITGLEVTEKEVDAKTRKMYEALSSALPEEIVMSVPDRFVQVSFIHRCENGEPVSFSPHDESEGTLAYFGLLGPVLDTLESGGVLLVDELAESLHPLLALEIVRLFNDETRNPKGAQLIFNTHDTNLLDQRVLRRDQIWFTEKDNCGATHLYALTDFTPRREENLERGYLQGRFGGVPFLRNEEAWSLPQEGDAPTLR